MEPHVKYRRPRWKKVSGHLAAAIGTVLIATSTPLAHAAPANGEVAGSSESTLSQLVKAATAKENQASELELNLGTLREAVNRALVDLKDAQVAAEKARLTAKEARKALTTADEDVLSAQSEFSKIAQSAFKNGATAGQPMYAGADNVGDALDRASFLRGDAEKQAKVIDELDQKRTEQANKESQLRVARTDAEMAEGKAKDAQTTAETALTTAEKDLETVIAERDKAIADRDLAQAKLKAAREAIAKIESEPNASPAAQQQRENDVAQEAADSVVTAEKKSEEKSEPAAEPAAPAPADEPAAQAPAPAPAPAQEPAPAPAEQGSQGAQDTQGTDAAVGDALTDALNTALDVANQLAEGQLDHTDLENPFPAANDIEADTPDGITIPEQPSTDTDAPTSGDSDAEATPEATVEQATDTTSVPATPESDSGTSVAPSVAGMSRAEQIEVVISRAMGQIGQPYAWGGGNASGPTKGIRDGGVADRHGDFNKIGFDCSGLTLYAYAGLGIDLPHFTGYQYQRGTQVPASQMQRGDLIFYGPNGHGHVAIALGDGTMIEAPQSGGHVQVVPVRWNGMTPNVVRLV
ncbi:DIP1281 family NlpC/P60 protein [Corynebacterium ulceribovis]|uniref:DIP1281 family NlpC/P60 protein n=1 Tax=Corynebacterium ulceribovis TaxID=487732 RepID=UPI00036060DF|nr:NlpC/P60 family protein [Corynebacterium ulceribovis]